MGLKETVQFIIKGKFGSALLMQDCVPGKNIWTFTLSNDDIKQAVSVELDDDALYDLQVAFQRARERK